MNHEEEFVSRFVVPEKRRRYLSLLESPKGRKKLLDSLDHFSDLDSRYAHPLPTNAQTVKAVEAILKQKGAPDKCHVLSSDPDLDNQEMGLSDAIVRTLGHGAGTVISCIPGKLGYFEGEEPNTRYILERELK